MKLLNQLLALSLSLSLIFPSGAAASSFRRVSATAVPGLSLQAAPSAAIPSLPGAVSSFGIPSISAAPAPGPLSAKPALQALGGELRKSEPGSRQSARALDLAFEARQGAGGGASLPVSAAGPALGGPLPLSASTARGPSESNEPKRPSANKSKIALIAGIAAAVVAVVVVVALVMRSGAKQNELWESTSARQQIVQVERALGERNAPELIRLADDSRAKQEAAGARLVGKKGDEADKEKLEESGFGLARMRGETGANGVSNDPNLRPGKELSSSWQKRLEAAQQEAYQSGSARRWLAVVRELESELKTERELETRYAGDLDRFGKQVPTARGQMGADYDAGARDLAGFRGERQTEEDLATKARAEIRVFVADRLAASSPEFKNLLERRDRLAEINAGTLATLDETAAAIDRDLNEMSAKRRSQRDNLRLADQHRADPVLDGAGKPITGPDGKPMSVDNSQPYKDKAAADDASAKAAAASLKANLEAFNRDLATLRRDGKVAAEGLDQRLPRSASPSSMSLDDWQARELLDPWQLEMRRGKFSEKEAADARALFGAVKGRVEQVQQDSERELRARNQAINDAVDEELRKQNSGW